MPQFLQPSEKPARARRFGLVVASFNAEITDAMRDGAVSTLRAAGVADEAIEIAAVPGAFELPLACRTLLDTERFDAIVALGCVIRGETPHFDFVAGETARGCMQLGLERGVPVVFGVLTTDTLAQARHRATPGLLTGSNADTSSASEKVTPQSNKGAEAAQVALDMAALIEGIRS